MELRTSQDELNKEPDFPVNDLEELREFVRSSPELPNIPGNYKDEIIQS